MMKNVFVVEFVTMFVRTVCLEWRDNMGKVLMKGNHALAEAAIRAGCRFFSGYPITPQSEIVEYMSWRLPEIGGTFVQTESELAGISMLYGAASCGFRAMTSSSGPGFSLLQEGISYLCSGEVPAVIADVMRYGNGLGDIKPAQSDYLQITKNGGHGDYRCISLAPSTIQESVDLMRKAYELAEKHRNPVIIATDGALGQIVESVELPEPITHDPDQFDWSIKDKREEKQKIVTSKIYYDYIGKDYDDHIRERYEAMKQEEMWEDYYTEDAEIILASYGIVSRCCKEAVLQARENGLKLGLIRPITLWPFPVRAFQKVSPKAFVAVEKCALPQMAEDVVVAARNIAPVYSMATGSFIPSGEEIINFVQRVMKGKESEL